MRNLDTPVKQIRRKIFTEIAKIGFESTDESMIHDIESIPYNIVEERAKYRESIYRERAVASERVRLAMGLSLRPENRSVHLTDGVKSSNIDEKYYEHELNLKNYDLESGYMLGINEDVLKVRHEKDKIIMTSLKESFRDWEAYRFIGKIDTSSHGYTYEMLSNSRKSSFFQNYREQQESFLGSRTELFWMVQRFENNFYVELEKCEVLGMSPNSCLEGDMNPFLGSTIFPMETRKILALYFRRKGQKKNFCEDMVRFFVSQIQLSVCEYKCVGILMDSHL